MPTELKMPALSPTMEEGTLAKWLVKEGDEVKSGDILAEIETDKATMEFEAVDEGKIAKILVPEGTDGVKVGAPIAILAAEGEDVSAAPPKADTAPAEAPKAAAPAPKADETPKSPPAQAPVETPAAPPQPAAAQRAEGDRVKASPLARRLAQAQNVDLNALQGSGPGGRIVRADVDAAVGKAPAAAPAGAPAAAPAPALGGHAVLPGVIEQAKSVFVQANPTLLKDLNEVALKLRAEYAPRSQEVVNEVAKLYAARFTEQELKDMLAFYKSPLGKKLLIEEPSILDQSMRNAQSWADRLSQEVIGKIRTEMKRRGHEI